MLYTPSTAYLWPRLVHAAWRHDRDMAAQLLRLMQQGAALTLDADRSLRLSNGQLPSAEFRAAVGTRLEPRYPRLSQALVDARAAEHPWVEAVKQRLYKATERSEAAFAVMLSEALYTAGYSEFEGTVRHWLGVWHSAGSKPGNACIVDTSDGALWVTDDPRAAIGPADGVLVLTDLELGNILARIDSKAWWREAG